MILGFDLSIKRHPFGGTARYADELFGAMSSVASAGDRVVGLPGFRRFRRGRRILRYVNFVSDVAWNSVAAPVVAARAGIDLWYSPSNIVPIVLQKPRLVTIHDVNFLLNPEAYDRAYRRYAGVMFPASARRAAQVITDSEFSRSHLLAAFGLAPEKVRVVYPGIDHARSSDGGMEKVVGLPLRYALFIGQTEPQKNVGLLLDAWAGAAPADLHLVIAGPPGRGHEAILERASRPPLRNRVTVLGTVSEAQLNGLYDAAACFLLPSRAEGFGFPALEAMARRVPTGVARAGSLPEVTRGGAMTFDPDDAVELAHCVAELVTPCPSQVARVAAGVAIAGTYRWDTAASELWAIARDSADT